MVRRRDEERYVLYDELTAVLFNITSKEQVIVNTWYGGEMKKGMFSMMNYYLPLKGIAAMHCSANTDLNGENTAIFFGLSGTGKTTLSTDPKRLLIHGEHESHVAFLDEISDVDICPVHLFCHGEDCR